MEKAGPYEQAILLLDAYSLDGADEKRKRAQALLEEAVALRAAWIRGTGSPRSTC